MRLTNWTFKAMKIQSKILLLLGLLIVSTNSHALTPSEIFAKVKNSIVVVVVMDDKGEEIGIGSGVYLPSGKVATNCHVVESAVSVKISYQDQFHPATLYGGDVDRDICLLQAPSLRATPVTLGNAALLNVGDPAFAVGSPQGMELTLSDGLVSSLRGGFPPVIQTTAAISKGSSGGGLFDSQGRLVGITTAYLDGGQSLNFAMPVEWIAQIKPMASTQTASAPATTPKPNQSKANTNWADQAAKLEKEKNWNGLLAYSNRWKSAEPNDELAWYAAGLALQGLQKHQLAITEFVQAIKINQEIADFWQSIGFSLARENQLTDALDAYTMASELEPENDVAFFWIGLIQSDLGEPNKAVQAFQTAVSLAPKDPENWLELGSAYLELKQFSKADDALQQAYRIDSKNPDTLAVLAQHNLLVKNYPMATAYSQLAIKEDKDNELAWFVKGTTNLNQKRYSQAIPDLLNAIRVKADFGNAWYNLSLSYYYNNQTVEALQAYQALKSIDPKDAAELYSVIKP